MRDGGFQKARWGEEVSSDQRRWPELVEAGAGRPGLGSWVLRGRQAAADGPEVPPASSGVP